MTIGKIGKDIKKSVALTLILTMLLGLGVPFNVFAEEEPATDNEIYGMLYYADINKLNTDGSITESKNIELVLQKGKQPDDNKRLVVDSDGNKGIVKYSKVDAYPSWYKFAPTSNNYNIVKVDFKDKLQPTSIAGCSETVSFSATTTFSIKITSTHPSVQICSTLSTSARD